jgi:predicted SAM-dependent methyltransferase
MKRELIDRITNVAGWLKRGQRVTRFPYQPVKANIGCGLTVAPHWINIDGSLNAFIATWPRWLHGFAYRFSGAQQYYTLDEYTSIIQNNLFIHHDFRYGIPMPDNSAQYIYSSHFLEHLDRQYGRYLLKECWRVLSPGGTVRIAVPDLEHAWRMYLAGEKERMLHDYFFIDGATGFSQHRYLYDYEMLAGIFNEIGFVHSVRAQFRQGTVPDLDLLDNRADYTLFVEAQKPPQDL